MMSAEPKLCCIAAPEAARC